MCNMLFCVFNGRNVNFMVHFKENKILGGLQDAITATAMFLNCYTNHLNLTLQVYKTFILVH